MTGTDLRPAQGQPSVSYGDHLNAALSLRWRSCIEATAFTCPEG